MAHKVVVFGAGATGRGNVGLLAWQAGYELVFVDKNPALVERLRSAGRYTVRLVGGKNTAHEPAPLVVTGFKVYPHTDRAQIAAEIVDADLVLTAVFAQNLPDVAQTIALAVSACRLAGRSRPLNCIACENMMDNSTTLARHVRALLSGPDLAYCDAWFGFPDCMIGRVVPRPEPDPLAMIAEDYNEWTVRKEAFKGDPLPSLDTLERIDDQTARLERKLFLHNGGHAVCGYVGFHRGCRYIHEALADPLVAGHVYGAWGELGAVLQRKFSFTAASIDAYIADLARRSAVAELRDDILRVIRDPIRKLSAHERLVAPALLAVEYGLPRAWIVKGIAAGLRYSHPEDEPSLRLAAMLQNEGLDAVLREVCGIPEDSPLRSEITLAWQEWRPGAAAL